MSIKVNWKLNLLIIRKEQKCPLSPIYFTFPGREKITVNWIVGQRTAVEVSQALLDMNIFVLETKLIRQSLKQTIPTLLGCAVQKISVDAHNYSLGHKP